MRNLLEKFVVALSLAAFIFSPALGQKKPNILVNFGSDIG